MENRLLEKLVLPVRKSLRWRLPGIHRTSECCSSRLALPRRMASADIRLFRSHPLLTQREAAKFSL